MTLDEAKAYLERMSHYTEEQKKWNPRSWQDALNLSAWVSVAEYGNNEYQKRALKIIKSIQGGRK